MHGEQRVNSLDQIIIKSEHEIEMSEIMKKRIGKNI